MRSKTILFATAALAWSLTAAGALAETVAEFYKGKTVQFIVGSDVGSGGDTYNRLIAQFIGRHIPGNPTIVPQNMPAAGGIVHINYMYKQAHRDGTEVGLTREAVPFEPLLLGSKSKANFDVTKFNWLTSPNSFLNVALAWETSDVKTAADLLTKELIVGGVGQTGSTNDANILSNLLGFKFKVIQGYPGPAAVDLAMENGELEGRATAGWTGLTTRHADWLRDKKVKILYQMGATRHPNIPSDVPTLMELAKTEEQKTILMLKYASNEIGFPFMLPPDVPQDRVDAMRKAFVDTYKDPDFIAAAKSQGVEVFPVAPERIMEVYKQAYSAPRELVEKLAELSKAPAK